MEDNLIFVMIDWLRYGEDEEVVQMTVQQYAEMLHQRKTRQIPACVIQRVSPTYYRQYLHSVHREQYSQAIQKKYNVGADWRQKRWFVEQVRPQL